MRSAISSRPTQRSQTHSRSPSKALSPNKPTSKPHTSTLSQPSPPRRPPTATTQPSPASRARLLHSLHMQHNGRLMMEVEREEQREVRREALLAATREKDERWRLEGSFGLERGEAQERLTGLSAEYERQMALKMAELGMIGGWDNGPLYSGEWEEKKQLSAKKKSSSGNNGTSKSKVRAG